MQEVDDIIEILPEEENDESLSIAPEEACYEYFRSTKSSRKRHKTGTGI